jgi:4'-phosphopantetheinyl transferase
MIMSRSDRPNIFSWEPISVADDELHIWTGTVTEHTAAIGSYLDLLSPDERVRASRYRTIPLRNMFVTSRGVLRSLLARYLNACAHEIEFLYGRHGKPALGCHGGISFNVSHSSDRFLIGISSGCSIGVDIERVLPLNDVESLSEMCLTANEAKELRELSPTGQTDFFYRHWTCKEAYLKATGVGLSGQPNHVSILQDSCHSSRRYAYGGRIQVEGAWRIETIFLSECYAAAVAYQGRERNVHLLHCHTPIG